MSATQATHEITFDDLSKLTDREIQLMLREVDTKDLYAAWKNWCEEQGRDHPGTAQTFGRDLRASIPSLKTSQPRDEAGDRYRLYQGVTLK